MTISSNNLDPSRPMDPQIQLPESPADAPVISSSPDTIAKLENLQSSKHITATHQQGDVLLPDTPQLPPPDSETNIDPEVLAQNLQQAAEALNLVATTLAMQEALVELIEQSSPDPSGEEGTAGEAPAGFGAAGEAPAGFGAAGKKGILSPEGRQRRQEVLPSGSDNEHIPPGDNENQYIPPDVPPGGERRLSGVGSIPIPGNAFLKGSFYTVYMEVITQLASMMSDITRANAEMLLQQMKSTAQQIMDQFNATTKEGDLKAAQFKELACNELISAVTNLVSSLFVLGAGVATRGSAKGNADFRRIQSFSQTVTSTTDAAVRAKANFIQADYAPHLAYQEALKSFFGQYVRMSQDFEGNLRQGIQANHDQIRSLFEGVNQNIRTLKGMVWR